MAGRGDRTRYRKVLFIIPKFLQTVPVAPFNGVGFLSEHMSSKGVEHEVIDMNLGYEPTEVFRRIREYGPDLIGFFLVTMFYRRSYRLIDYVRKKFDIPVVAGGPHVSTFRRMFMEDCTADFGVKLEGENTLMELIEGKDPKDIAGLLHRVDCEVVENPDRPFIEDLDTLRFPRYGKFELERYKDRVIAITSSRGCPYQCIYCPCRTAIGRQFRVRSAKDVFDEIKYWYDAGYRKIYFNDDNFTLLKPRVMELCRLVRESDMTGMVLNCPNGVRADRVDREVLTAMKDAGFKTIAFGVEGGNNKVLKALKKGETIEDIDEKIGLACELGFDVGLFFLIGAPGETEEDVEDSFRLALKHPVADAFFYSIIPFPETELYEWVEREQLWTFNPDQYLNTANGFSNSPFFETKELPKEKREYLLEKGKRIGRIIRKRSIIRRARERYGTLGLPLGYFLGSSFADKYVLQNRFFLRTYTYYLSRRARR